MGYDGWNAVHPARSGVLAALSGNAGCEWSIGSQPPWNSPASARRVVWGRARSVPTSCSDIPKQNHSWNSFRTQLHDVLSRFDTLTRRGWELQASWRILPCNHGMSLSSWWQRRLFNHRCLPSAEALAKVLAAQGTWRQAGDRALAPKTSQRVSASSLTSPSVLPCRHGNWGTVFWIEQSGWSENTRTLPDTTETHEQHRHEQSPYGISAHE